MQFVHSFLLYPNENYCYRSSYPQSASLSKHIARCTYLRFRIIHRLPHIQTTELLIGIVLFRYVLLRGGLDHGWPNARRLQPADRAQENGGVVRFKLIVTNELKFYQF